MPLQNSGNAQLKSVSEMLMRKMRKGENIVMRKIKKLVATLLATTMVMAMGVTAFAADTLADGTYSANQNLYKILIARLHQWVMPLLMI